MIGKQTRMLLVLGLVLVTAFQLSGTPQVLPRLVAFGGSLRDHTGKPLTGIVGLTFSIYSEETGGAPLWIENQNVQLDPSGGYTALLGATRPEGIPIKLFTSGQSRWLGVQAELQGEEEQPRVLLSVPYAVKAADADTIGGLPPSAFVLARPDDSGNASSPNSRLESRFNSGNVGVTALASSGTGTSGNIAKWVDNSGTLGNSVLTEQNSNIGINTATPAVPLEIDGSSELLRLNSTGNTMLSLMSSGSNHKNRSFFLDQFGKFYLYNLTDGTPEFVVDRNHQIGVGTANPAAPFHIFSPGPAFAHVEGTSAGIDVGWLIRNNAPLGKQWAIRSSGAGQMIFRDDSLGAERFTLDANGNVGVGTSNPTAKLEINGSAKAGSFTGDGSGLTNLSPSHLIGTLSNNQTSATSNNNANAIVLRDASGNFNAGTITANTFSGSGAALTNVNASTVNGVSSTAVNTRGIVYLAGCDTCTVLQDTDDQQMIYLNVIGAMTINSVTCYSDAGTPLINIHRAGGQGNILASDLPCSTSGATGTIFLVSGSSLSLNDSLDFVMVAAGGTAKRVTVIIKATVN